MQGILTRWRDDRMTFLADALTHSDGTSYGATLDEWQREDFATFFDTLNHTWWERPRGHDKTGGAAAVALTELLFGTPGGRLYFTATDSDQAALAYDSVRGYVNRSPLLSSVLRVLKREIVFDALDSKLEVLPADASGSWGLRPSFVLADELHAWRTQQATEFFEALYSSLGKVKGARMLVTTTAGWDRTSLCWRLREQVKDDPSWTFSRVGQCASWVSADFLAQQKRLLPAHSYAMLHDNIWTDAGGAFLTYAEVRSIFDERHRPALRCPHGPHYIALDVGLSNDATAVVVLHRNEDGTAEVDEIKTWRGQPGDRVDLAAVGRWIVDATRRFKQAEVIADPWQAVGLIQDLRRQGVRANDVTFSASYRTRLFTNLLDVVRGGKLVSFPHETLQKELLGLEFRDVGGNLRVDHRPGQHDDHVVALAMALLAAVERPALVLETGQLFIEGWTIDAEDAWRMELLQHIRERTYESRIEYLPGDEGGEDVATLGERSTHSGGASGGGV